MELKVVNSRKAVVATHIMEGLIKPLSTFV
jgi:hypothetical protein